MTPERVQSLDFRVKWLVFPAHQVGTRRGAALASVVLCTSVSLAQGARELRS